MCNLNWHRSFDLCKLVDARVDALGLNGLIAETDLLVFTTMDQNKQSFMSRV